MKKTLLVLLFVYIAISSSGQTIPNGSFENWTSTTFENPQNYPQTSNSELFGQAGILNVVKTADAHAGSHAVKMTTVTSKGMMAYITNSDPVNDVDPATWTGGIPYTEKPTGIQGYYKYNVADGDQATIIVAFRDAAGLNIGSYPFQIGGAHNEYTYFYFDIPALSVTPAKVIFAATSSILANMGGPEGSELFLDDVSFTGVSSQPALLNGGFESWDLIQTPLTLDDWYTMSGGDGDNGIHRTASAVDGTYALELITHEGRDQSDNPNAQSGQVTTGYNDNSGNNIGGIPYTSQSGTLAFSYKYAPQGNDTAQINLDFRKNNGNVGGAGMQLQASAEYQYKEISFNLGQAPDMMNIQISSSNGNNLEFIGSDLIIDNLHFKGPAQMIWTGSTDNNWNNGGNWMPNTVPTAADDITIPNTSSKPFIMENFGSPTACNNLTIESGAMLTINQGNALTVSGVLDNKAGPSGLVVFPGSMYWSDAPREIFM